MGHHIPHADVVGMNIPLFQPRFGLRNVLILKLVNHPVFGLATDALPAASANHSGAFFVVGNVHSTVPFVPFTFVSGRNVHSTNL